MKLRDFLDIDGNSATKLAEDCGVSISTITRAANGDTLPNKELMAAIHSKTGGAVTPNDFFGIGAGEPSPEAAAA
jgi:transcriptional regulator with XRE-family HTH domain